ncbi:hypothetical protein CcaverHIS631_0507860 [Cutaneotrichosporon cavernicola]|nr:hypothetical protein CcaverHIS631_0507860 [Cutaneotrichosporon cavernicola]
MLPRCSVARDDISHNLLDLLPCLTLHTPASHILITKPSHTANSTQPPRLHHRTSQLITCTYAHIWHSNAQSSPDGSKTPFT